MKRIVLFLAVLVLLQVCCSAASAPQKKITVSTVQEFLDALGDDRIITLNESMFLLTPVIQENREALERKPGKGPKVFFVEETDGPELHIANMKNLTIEAGIDIVQVLSEPRYANVISFDNCTDLKIKGVTFGHTDEGYCSQGVLGFYGCEDVSLERCDLFGCGTEGIIVEECEDFEMSACKIRDCSYHIMHLSESINVTFKDCQFFRNREFTLVNVSVCSNVTFRNCMFANNTGPLFSVESKIVLYDCVILHQEWETGINDKVILINCITEDLFNNGQALG